MQNEEEDAGTFQKRRLIEGFSETQYLSPRAPAYSQVKWQHHSWGTYRKIFWCPASTRKEMKSGIQFT